jgi:tol-pal system protein YbgF
MELKILKLFLIFSLTTLLALGCAGSRDESEEPNEQQQQQKELDDIEALLGIASPQEDTKTKKEPEKKPEGEKLDLLNDTDRINMTQPEPVSPEKQKELENKVSQLEKQVRQKDLTIADLNSKIAIQAEELSSKPKTSYPSSSTTTIVSDISMEEYESRYEEARSEFENRNYQSAISLFESLMSASTSHSLSDNAQYWIGECHYALRQYDAAIIDFEKVFTFPKSNKLDDAQYKLGLCYIRKGDTVKAKEELNRLINSYPKSEYISKAENLLAKN